MFKTVSLIILYIVFTNKSFEFSTSVNNEFPEKKGLYKVHAKDNYFIYLDKYKMMKNGLQIERYILPYIKDLARNSILKTDNYCYISFNKQTQKYEIEEFKEIDIKSLKKKIIKELLKQKENISKTAYNNIPSSIDKEKILIRINEDIRSEVFIEDRNDTILVKTRLFHADILDKRKIPAGLTLFCNTLVKTPGNEITGSYLDWEVAWYD